MEPEEKNNREWYEWFLREECNFNPIFFRRSIERGLDLAVLRNYLDALENKETGDEFSAALMKGYGFNTTSLKIAFNNMLDLSILRKYIEILEAEKSGDQKKASMSTKSYIALLAVLIIIPLFANGCRNFWPVAAGVIGGAILIDALTPRPTYYPPPICYDYIYGEWQRDYYGNQYWHDFRHPRQVQVPCR